MGGCYGFVDKPSIGLDVSYVSINNKMLTVYVKDVKLTGDWPESFRLREATEEIKTALNSIISKYCKETTNG